MVAVEEGAALVKFRGAARAEQNIADLIKRRAFYQDRLDRAQAAGKKSEMESMQAKVEEKSQALGEAAKELAGLSVVAPRAGDFRPAVKKLGNVQEGDILGTITGEPVTSAEFSVEDASAWVQGDEVALTVKADGKKVVCSVEESSATAVRVRCVGAYEPGTEVILPPVAAAGP